VFNCARTQYSAHAATLNSNGGPSGLSGSGEFGVIEIDKLFNHVGRPVDQQMLDFINGFSGSGFNRNLDSGIQNGNSDSGLFSPNAPIELFSFNTGNSPAASDQNLTNGALAEFSFAPTPTGQFSAISTGLSNAIVNSSLGLSVGVTSDRTLAGPTNIITAFIADLPLGTGSAFVNSISDSTAPVVSNAPLPAALPLFATGLGGLAFLGWLRKRKACPRKN
jgi:hypothetical protein